MNAVFTLAIIFAAYLFPVAAAEAVSPDGLGATFILERMAKTYAECYTYCDSGIVRTVFINGDDRRTDEKTFKTAFVRSSNFRFEFRARKGAYEDHVYIVWRDENETRAWWDISSRVEKPESLGLALAGATGVSGGSAHTVPVLLLPNEVGGRRITDISDTERIGDSECMHSACFRIEGKYSDRSVTVWIDKQTYLLRIIEWQDEIDDFRVETTTLYDPIINSEIDEDALRLNAPDLE